MNEFVYAEFIFNAEDIEQGEAQVAALGARRALVQAIADRQITAVALIQSLGGGWQAAGPDN